MSKGVKRRSGESEEGQSNKDIKIVHEEGQSYKDIKIVYEKMVFIWDIRIQFIQK